MMSIERILCPVNLPPESDEALRYALLLARAYNASLSLCHCTPTPALLTTLTTGATHNGAKKELEDAVRRYGGTNNSPQLPCDVVVVDGGRDVGQEIVRTARERLVDLIVMGSRRVAALFGPNTEQVFRTASCPVLVIHPQDGREPKVQFGFRRILVAHDFSSGAELALSYALSIARPFRAELHLLHVLPEPEENEPAIAWNEVVVTSAYHRALKRLKDSVPADGNEKRSVMPAVRWGKPYREVLDYAREHDVNLVCMGALGRDFGRQALFGSNVDRVLRQVSCPVLIANPLRPANSPLVDVRTMAVHIGGLSSLLGSLLFLVNG
jgi:nucleotide-binding universal stress UspA family protein